MGGIIWSCLGSRSTCLPGRWEEFQAVVEEREPKILRAFTAMPVDAQGHLKVQDIQGGLQSAPTSSPHPSLCQPVLFECLPVRNAS